tara:strand:- start:211 stop:474 length:264 start_codon:yes stop_codon:yes gene_type:complete
MITDKCICNNVNLNKGGNIMDEKLKQEVIQSKAYLDMNDLAALTGLSISTIRRRIEEGKLKALQHTDNGKLLFKRLSVEKWLEGGAK